MVEVLDFWRGMRWQDWVDILAVAFLIYQAILFIRGTRSMQMLLGLAVVFVAFLASRRFELLTLNWILNNFLTYIIVILVILFQADIRRALTQVGRNPFGRSRSEMLPVVGEVIRAAAVMAEKRIGALIVFAREVGLNDYIEVGTLLSAKVSAELLLSLFNPGTPLHDGAVVIQEDQLAAAACFLPLTTDPAVSRTYGTRHRAALGLTQETDVVALVVSEETGKISLAVDGRISSGLSQNELRERLSILLNLTAAGRAESEGGA